MHSQIIHNGRLGPVGASLSPGQLGLLTGWGVFTTLRIYQGVPFAFEWHWERMQRDAEKLRVKLGCSAEQIRSDLARLIEANRAEEAAARVYFVRNAGGVWSASTDRDTDYLLFTADLSGWPASSRLAVAPQSRHAASPMAGVKVLSWVGNVATLEDAQARGFDEVLLLNERDEVAECTAANVFIVRAGKVLTPPMASGCLPGVTRRAVFAAAPAAGVAINEQAITMDDVRRADELFITSTTREIMPIREVDGTSFTETGAVTARVRGAFRSYVREYITAQKNLQSTPHPQA